MSGSSPNAHQMFGFKMQKQRCPFGLFRDVSSVELLMNNHQGIKAEIDARNDSFTSCVELGKSLLSRKHYASEEVRINVHASVSLLITVSDIS